MPRKSRTRGRATLTSRSKNSYMRSPRRVTMQPIAWPSRSLNCEMDLAALVMTGFWPAIWPSSLTAPSISLAFCVASPSPMLIEIFSILGRAIAFLYPNSLVSPGTTLFRYCSLNRAAMESSLPVERLAALAADPGAADLAAGERIDVVPDARSLAAAGANHHHVGSRYGAFPFCDAALDLLRWVRAGVALDHHHVLHQQLARLAVHPQHAARLALVAARDHLDGVFLLEIHANRRGGFFSRESHQITSGASETIFMNRFSRSSLATGPNTRVPTGSPTSLISTAAFESKRMYVPSLRRVSLRMRTITQRTTFPFLMAESGAASFTAAVTTSPSPARQPGAAPARQDAREPARARVIGHLENRSHSNHSRFAPMSLQPSAFSLQLFPPLRGGLS